MSSNSDTDERIATLVETWRDITPAQNTPASTTVAAIQYTPYHRHLLHYLRAIINTEERSHRVLDLTTSVIEANPASYTAWQLRWECLRALGVSLDEELGDNADVVADNPKNYQDWNHRRKCFDALGEEWGVQVGTWGVYGVCVRGDVCKDLCMGPPPTTPTLNKSGACVLRHGACRGCQKLPCLVTPPACCTCMPSVDQGA